MHHPPLNRDRDPTPWPHFDPGRFVDLNPSFVRLENGQAWVAFCRYAVPPVPGQASVWAVRVNDDLDPAGEPVLLLGQGSDPRLVRLGERVLVFYALFDRNADGAVSGCSIAMADFSVHGGEWNCLRNSLFPKHPIEGKLAAAAHQDWEKNWIPFAVGDADVALIYAHEPWNVIRLHVPADAQPHFETLYQGAGLQWDYGTIRGGTPPVRFDDDHLVTFFHASQRIGSRMVYSAGACVFLAAPPYTPVSCTAAPLLMAPYRSGVQRFGWNYAISVIFPSGAERVGDEYRLLCGRDDGEIVRFSIGHDELRDRLGAINSGPAGTVHDYRDGAGARLPLGGLLYVPDPIPGIPELPMVNFLKALAGHGRTFVDVGAHIGFYTMGLAPGFDRVVAFEPSRFQHRWLSRNRALNDYRHVQIEHVALGDIEGEATLNVLSYEGGLNSLAPEVAAQHAIIEHYTVPVLTLDGFGLADVDLLKIDVEGFEVPVLRGAARTIRASRPVILLEVWEQPDRRQSVQDVLDELGYSFEFLFPMSPELAICLPRERRQAFDWFI